MSGATGPQGCMPGAVCQQGQPSCDSVLPGTTQCMTCQCMAAGTLQCAPCASGATDGGSATGTGGASGGTGPAGCTPGAACQLDQPVCKNVLPGTTQCIMCQCSGAGALQCAPCGGGPVDGGSAAPPPSDAGASPPCGPGLACPQAGYACGGNANGLCEKCMCGADLTYSCTQTTCG